MKRSRAKHLNVGDSQHEPSSKPFGFCCDLKEKSWPSFREQPQPLFPTSFANGEGPDIKFRIQEDDSTWQSARVRGKYRGGQQISRGDDPRGRRRWNGDGKLTRIMRSAGERMVCERCRGPMQFYLEDEVASAMEIMMNDRREKRHAEAERNVRLAKEKERKKRRKKKKTSKQEEKTAEEDDAI